MKPPKIISIVGYRNASVWNVTITIHMFKKLPEWVRILVGHWYPNNHRHVVISIRAVDELQAMARFLQLWNGLPKEET